MIKTISSFIKYITRYTEYSKGEHLCFCTPHFSPAPLGVFSESRKTGQRGGLVGAHKLFYWLRAFDLRFHVPNISCIGDISTYAKREQAVLTSLVGVYISKHKCPAVNNVFTNLSAVNSRANGRSVAVIGTNEDTGNSKLVYFLEDYYPHWAVTTESYNQNRTYINGAEQVNLSKCQPFAANYWAYPTAVN